MSQLDIKHYPATIHYFTEALGDNSTMNMVLIPAGSFQMGSPEDELARSTSESPQHTVAVPTFFMGQTPVTQAQWRQVAKLSKVKNNLKPNPSHFKGDDRPVEQVSWNDAIEFCHRLSRYTGRNYRLPSEAEWEYACRAGTTTPFHFGETIDAQLANYQAQNEKINSITYPGKYRRGNLGKYRQQTTSISHFLPNQFGLYDMHGNVWEWCQDSWHDSYKNAPTDGTTWEDKQSPHRVSRGGCWFTMPRFCRSGSRGKYSPDIQVNFIGVRVVCSIPETSV